MDYGMVCIDHSWHNTSFSKLNTPFVRFKGKKSKGHEIRESKKRTNGEERRGEEDRKVEYLFGCERKR